MSIDRQEMLDIACRAAIAAGEAILRVYAEGFDVRHKTDKTPVTEADLAAERIIIDRLLSAFPDIPCVAEELCESEGTPPWTCPARSNGLITVPKSSTTR